MFFTDRYFAISRQRERNERELRLFKQGKIRYLKEDPLQMPEYDFNKDVHTNLKAAILVLENAKEDDSNDLNLDYANIKHYLEKAISQMQREITDKNLCQEKTSLLQILIEELDRGPHFADQMFLKKDGVVGLFKEVAD